MMLLPVGRMYIRMESAMSIIVDKSVMYTKQEQALKDELWTMCRVQLMTENL